LPIYEYLCIHCRKAVSLLARQADSDARPTCPECGGESLQRLVSSFAFHRSFTSKLEQLDPKYDKMVAASNPDLSFDSLVKQYGLDRPAADGEK
jgi:putative FmdB family regulatory protein